MGADSQEHGGKTFFFEIFQEQFRSESDSGSDLNPVFENMIYFIVQHLRRQAVVRNPYPQHAAQLIKRFENGDLKAFQPQVICDG